MFGNISATTIVVDVEASSPQEALDLFFDTSEATPSICHQCSDHIEIGEVYQGHVMDKNHAIIYTDAMKTYSKQEIIKLLQSDKTKEDLILELQKDDN